MDIPATLRSIRATLDLSQSELAERLGVSFATVNRWEGGAKQPQKAAIEAILALADEAGIDNGEAVAPARVVRPRGGKSITVPTTKPMEQMLWDAACSIRGEKDAAKFKDYLLPLLFLKRLSDVFDDEIARLSEEYDDRATALEITASDHSLLRFYLPPEARWAVISGRETFDWPLDDRGRPTTPRDIGEHLTKAVRAVVKQNPSLSGVIDVVDFAAERNGERDVNPAKLRGVVETFSDPRYRLGLADVQPDFLGRAYEYLLRKFAEGSGQSAGEFFTPTEVGFLMAHILRPRPGETCHDYACGSAGLLIKLQLVARELDPTSRVPLRLSGQELQAESYAVAQMNAIIHDMEVELARGDTIINPKFRDASGKILEHDIVVANPMWNQPFSPEIFANDPFDRFRTAGGITIGKGDWAWLQHTLACMDEHGRAAVVLDTGAVTRGSGSKNEDKERNIRKWFVENDFIDGVILLPENLFYNTTSSGVIVVLNKRKSAARRNKIVLLNASRRVRKGRPKNYIPEEDIRTLATMFLKAEPIDGELSVITCEQADEADYNLSPSRWVGQTDSTEVKSISSLISELQALDANSAELSSAALGGLFAPISDKPPSEAEIELMPEGWNPVACERIFKLTSGKTRPNDLEPVASAEKPYPVLGGNGVMGYSASWNVDAPGIIVIGRVGEYCGAVHVATGKVWITDNALYTREWLLPEAQLGFIAKFLEYYDLNRFKRVAGQPLITQGMINEHSVPLPGPDEQGEIVAILDAIDHKLALHRQMGTVLEELVQSVLHKLMTGNIRVGELDLSMLPARQSAPGATL